MTIATRRGMAEHPQRAGWSRRAEAAGEERTPRQGQSAGDTRGFEDAVAALLRGGIVAYPTETLYALGACWHDDGGLRRLVRLKGREEGKAIAVIIGDVDMLGSLVEDISASATTLMERFWPGPLTIVFSARRSVSPLLTGGQSGIGVRLSSHPVARALSCAVGAALTAPSANPGGRPAPRRMEEARAYFGEKVDVYLDGGVLPGEPPSTVVDARHGVAVIRDGAIPAEAVRAAVQEVR